MWQRFTERGRKAIFYSQEEAQKHKSANVAPEHLLLGLLREDDNTAVRALAKLGINSNLLRKDVEKLIVSPNAAFKGTDMTLTPKAKRCIDMAYDEARLLSHNYIGTEHLLLGIYRLREGIPDKVLQDHKVELEPLRRAVLSLVGERRPFGVKPKAGFFKKVLYSIFDGMDLNDPEGKTVLSDRMIAVLALAKTEAVRLGQPEISPSIVLLALSKSDHGPKALLESLEIDPALIAKTIEDELVPGNAVLNLEPAIRTELSVLSAFEWAQYYKRTVAEPEDVVLALVHGRETFARRVLLNFGADLTAVQAQVAKLTTP